MPKNSVFLRRVEKVGLGSADDGFLVGREAGTLVQERSDLPLELADRPMSVKAFRFVEGPLERIVDTDQFDEMRPGEP